MDGDSPVPSWSFQPLSRREREILMLLSQGLSDREIAEHLVIARTTVKWYNRQIFNKLGAENRQQAVEFARSLGLLAATEAQSPLRHNLPASLTPFVGRSRELSELRHWLSKPNTRLITLLGPGGMGKTRLALQVAEAELKLYADGIFLVPLGGLTTSDSLISQIAEAIDLHFVPQGRSTKQQLFDALRHKHLLLVLDNFEHLLENAVLVAELLSAAPEVQAIVTSREKLNVTGELIYPLAGLETPNSATAQEILAFDAVQLFVNCAERANPHFVPRDTQSIAQVCRLVEGMPLAIELAAAWSGTLSPAEIVSEVARSADFLQTTMSDVPERLRSVRIVFDAAWARLSDEDRQVFQRMAVFRGGCTREAAQQVTGADVTALARLVDKALLWRNAQTGRYEIHELLRQYAEQQLKAAGEFERTEKAHQHYYAQLAETWGAATLADRQLEGLAVLDADADNVREALIHATAEATPEAIEPFTDLWLYYDLRCRWDEADKLFMAASSALEPHDSIALAKLLTGRAFFYERLVLLELELEVSTRSYEMNLRLGAHRSLPLAMVVYGDALRDQGRHDEALTIYQHGLVLAHEIDSPLLIAIFKFHLGNDAFHRNRWEEAKALMTEAFVITKKLNNLWAVPFTLHKLATFAYSTGNLDEAQRLYEETIRVARPIHHDWIIDVAVIGLSAIARARHDWHAVRRTCIELLRRRSVISAYDELFQVLANLAEAALILNELAEARRWISEALQVLSGWQVEMTAVPRMFPDTCVQLSFATGGLLTCIGDYRHGAVVLSYVATSIKSTDLHEFATEPIKDLVPKFLDECRAALAPSIYDEAVERGRLITIETVFAEFVIVLK